MNADQQIATMHANGFTNFFGNIFKDIFTGDQAKQQETSIVSFADTEIGKLAVDAVQWVNSEMSAAPGIVKRTAAVDKLKTDALAAGKSLEAITGSTLIWFIETALQAAISRGLVLAVTAIAASSDDDDDRE